MLCPNPWAPQTRKPLGSVWQQSLKHKARQKQGIMHCCAFHRPALCEDEMAAWTLLSSAWRHFHAQRWWRTVSGFLNIHADALLAHCSHYTITTVCFRPLNVSDRPLLQWRRTGRIYKTDMHHNKYIHHWWQLSGYAERSPSPQRPGGALNMYNPKKIYWFLIWQKRTMEKKTHNLKLS